jgi:hypothetical protein
MNPTEFETMHRHLTRLLSAVEDALGELNCEPHEVNTAALDDILTDAQRDLDDALEVLP